MNIYDIIKTEVIGAANDVLDNPKTKNVTVEPTREKAHGDMASNAAMVLAKAAGMKPRDLAEQLATQLGQSERIASVEIAGPGFLNFRLAPTIWAEFLTALSPDFGRVDIADGKKVNVEFVSANPTGPLHVGHMRGAVVGDSLANLLDWAGYDVTREYYINDGGAQVDVLARSAYLRYLQAVSGVEPQFPDGTYPGEYLKPVGQALADEFDDQFVDADENAWLGPFRERAMTAMIELIKSDLARLGISYDKFFSERSLYDGGRIDDAIANLNKAGLIYEGTLPPPKGKPTDDWEPREQTLFKSTEYGDDVDRPIKKSDGGWTYFAPDIAYHYDKIERGFDELVDVLGADHGGYVKRMKAAVSALSGGQVPLDIQLTQLVRLFKDGEPFKMSKRAGNFVLLSDVLDEVGADVARFVIMTRKADAPIDFDFAKVKEQSKENPVWYVQYAHARANSVLKKSGIDDVSDADASLLVAEGELGLIKQLSNFPRLVEAAARAREPHRVAFYLYDLASAYHAHTHAGKLDPSLRFITDDAALTKARLTLVSAVKTTIANGLKIIGVSPLDDL